MKERELSNSQDPCAVAVKKGSNIMGHIPNKISSICSMFIHSVESILCVVQYILCYLNTPVHFPSARCSDN